ncbi:MAG: hypothetical protein ACREN1_00670 [Candidatus Dormibacteria bacterium]
MKIGSLPLQSPSVGATVYLAGATSVTVAGQQHAYTSSTPTNVWVVQIVAPPQGGYTSVTGVVIVDATTHQSLGYSLIASGG